MKNKKLLRILRPILLIVAGVVLGINIYSWNARSLTGNQLPMPFGYGAAVVLSGSMEPTIMTDELIIVTQEDAYQVGDVVVYQSGRILVVHRIVAMDEETVTTRGDANNVDDEPIPPEHIKGKVVAHIPHVGAAVRIIKTPWATALLVVAAVLTVELPFIRKKMADKKAREALMEEIRKLKEEQENT